MSAGTLFANVLLIAHVARAPAEAAW